MSIDITKLICDCVHKKLSCLTHIRTMIVIFSESNQVVTFEFKQSGINIASSRIMKPKENYFGDFEGSVNNPENSKINFIESKKQFFC